MSKQARLKEAEQYLVARRKVLSSDNPGVWIHRDGIDEWLGSVMNDIQNYMDASFMMDDNPLRYLRRCFPNFVWTFHECQDEKKAASQILSADYIWLKNFGFVGDCFITATEKNRKKHRVLCYQSKRDDVESVERLKLLVPGIRFVFLRQRDSH